MQEGEEPPTFVGSVVRTALRDHLTALKERTEQQRTKAFQLRDIAERCYEIGRINGIVATCEQLIALLRDGSL